MMMIDDDDDDDDDDDEKATKQQRNSEYMHFSREEWRPDEALKIHDIHSSRLTLEFFFSDRK